MQLASPNSPGQTKLAAEIKAPQIKPDLKYELDEEGYLYDARFRQMLRRNFRVEGDSLLGIEALRSLSIAGKALHQTFEDRLDQTGMSHQQFRALMWIKGAGPEGTQLHEIADWLCVTPRNITWLVDALEAQGLVERAPHPTDRRAVIARLTPAGQRQAQAAERIHRRGQESLMGILSREEKLQLRDMSLKLVRATEKLPSARMRDRVG